MLYRVDVHLAGVVRMEASSPEEAEAKVQGLRPTYAGLDMFGVTMYCETAGTVEDTVLDPQAARHVVGIREGER